MTTELNDLESRYDEIAVEPSVGPDSAGHWDVYVKSGYWDTVTTAFLAELRNRGEVAVYDRVTRQHWKAA